MAVRDKLLRMKFPLILAAFASLLLGFLFYLAPSFLNLVSYFWPLFLSTALFLAAIVVFGRISPPAPDVSGEIKVGEELLDYVASPPPVSSVEEEEEEHAEEATEKEEALKSQ